MTDAVQSVDETGSLPEQQQPAETGPVINLVDIFNAIRVIDFAATRGAFGGGELSQVGLVRDKFAKFLDSIPQEQKPAELRAAEAALSASVAAAASQASEEVQASEVAKPKKVTKAKK